MEDMRSIKVIFGHINKKKEGPKAFFFSNVMY